MMHISIGFFDLLGTLPTCQKYNPNRRFWRIGRSTEPALPMVTAASPGPASAVSTCLLISVLRSELFAALTTANTPILPPRFPL
ncbi:MAG: hypothetical protein HKL95_09535 [Phycisphaerae bacterium]|nr:hypothetical protein [Phycisphaerae bacterium]